jgi:hypothetical protein
MNVEDNWPASLGWFASRNPYIEMEAVLFFKILRFWCGVLILEQDIAGRIDWLWTDWAESGIVAWFARWLIKGKGCW